MAKGIDLRAAVRKALESDELKASDLSSITFSDLSRILARDLKVNKETLAVRKDEIADILLELCAAANSDESEEENRVEQLKRGKFSGSETKTILDEVHRYMAENDLAIEDICPELREEKRRTTHQTLWSYIQTLLPMRNKDQIYNHAIRKLTEEAMKKGPWSSQEKDALKSLVSTHGRDWRTISRILNRATFDCKDAYKILSERKSTGRFSKAEDNALIAAVRNVCRLPDSVPVSDLPAVNISWLNVAAVLKNLRLPLDYQRRWGVLRVTADRPEQEEFSETKQNASLEADLRILRYLDERNVTDETEVIWTDIDEALGFPKNRSYSRWKALCKKMNFSITVDFTTRLETLLFAHGVEYGGLGASMEMVLPVKAKDPARIERNVSRKRNIAEAEGNEESESGREDDADGEKMIKEEIMSSEDEAVVELARVKLENVTEGEVGDLVGESEEDRRRRRREKKERKRARKEAKRAKKERKREKSKEELTSEKKMKKKSKKTPREESST